MEALSLAHNLIAGEIVELRINSDPIPSDSKAYVPEDSRAMVFKLCPGILGVPQMFDLNF